MHISSPRNFGLDLIRTLAICLVVLSHCTYILYPASEAAFVTVFRVLGAIGVDLFFVLSGFLIGGILLKNIESCRFRFSDLMLFWKRRWLRTLPNYLIILILNALLILFLDGEFPDRIGYYIVFIQNFSSGHPDFFTESWSLSIEEYAYLVGPFFLYLSFYLFKESCRKQLFLWVTLLLITALTILKVRYYFNTEIESYQQWSHSFRKVVVYRIDAIYIGFLLAYLSKVYKVFLFNNKIMMAVLGLLIFGFLHVFIYLFDILPQSNSVFYIFFYLQVVLVSLGLTFPFFISVSYSGILFKSIEYISKRSYAIYLTNYSLVFLSLERFFDLRELSFYTKLLLVLFFLIITLLFSEILYRYFEKPILKFRNRKFPS